MMEVITEKSPVGRVATVRLVLEHGAHADPVAKRGLAFLTARMLPRGAGGRSQLEIATELESLGGYLSAYADEEFTQLEGTVLSENLERFMRLLRTLLEEPEFTDEEIAKTRLKVEGEIRSAFEEPRTLAVIAVKRALFGGTPLQSLNRGEAATLAAITRDDLRSSWEAAYRAGSLRVGLASPWEDGRAGELLRAAWNGFRPGDPPRAPLPEPRFEGSRAIIVERPEMATAPFFLVSPGVRDREEDAVAADLANFCFGGDFTSRLMQSLRAENGWTYGVQSGFDQILSNRRFTSLFSVYAYPSAVHFGASLRESLRLHREFAEKGLTAEELDFARQSLGLSHVFEWETAAKRLEGRIRRSLTSRPFLPPREYRERLAALTLDGVNATIRARFPAVPPLLVVVGESGKLRKEIEKAGAFESIEIVEIHP